MTEVQQSLNLPLHSLKSDCSTRWGSTQLMIDTILEQKDAIRQILQSDSKTRHLKLTWQDLDVLESIKSAFGPLDEFTDALSAESEVTASSVKAVLHVLETDVLKVDTVNDSTLTKDIKKYVMEYLVNKYEPTDMQNILNQAGYLDPWFCDMYLDDDAKDTVKQMVTEEGEVLLSSLKLSVSDSEHAASKPPPPKKRKLGAWLEKERPSGQDDEQRELPLTCQQRVKKEIELYEKLPRADASSHPLEWWKVHFKEFPVLSLLAKQYLCVCASSASSERGFSAPLDTLFLSEGLALSQIKVTC